MATPQDAILTALGEHQWYVHLSRTDGADLGVIKKALADLRPTAISRVSTSASCSGRRFSPI